MADHLQAVEELQRFSRCVAQFLTTFDMWLTPTMSAPPALLGEIASNPEVGASMVAYPAVVANITGNPAMSVPLCWNAANLPLGVHFLGRFGDEATLFRLASQLEAARPWQARVPHDLGPKILANRSAVSEGPLTLNSGLSTRTRP